MSVLRTTALVDAPLRAVSAALSASQVISGDPRLRVRVGKSGPVAPGDEVVVAGCRLRVVESTVDGWRAVLVGGRAAALEVSVRLAATPAGVLVTCSSVARGLARSRVLAALTGLVERIRWRAAELVGAEVVVGAAIVRDGRLLAQQRAYPAADAGRWELPGGRVEPGEDDAAAVVRECAEELGVRVLAGEVVGPDVAIGRHRVLRVYRAELVAGDPRPHDHQALRWLSAGQLGSVPWLPADRVLLPAMRTLLRN